MGSMGSGTAQSWCHKTVQNSDGHFSNSNNKRAQCKQSSHLTPVPTQERGMKALGTSDIFHQLYPSSKNLLLLVFATNIGIISLNGWINLRQVQSHLLNGRQSMKAKFMSPDA